MYLVFFLLAVAATPLTQAQSCSGKFGQICGDCNTRWVCIGNDPPVFTQRCDVTFPGRPYCVNNGACSSVLPAGTTCSNGLTCTSAGTFPHPRDCEQSFTCSEAGGTATVHKCPSGRVFDAQTSQCKVRVWPADCSLPNCVGQAGNMTAHPTEPSLYVFCPAASSDIPIVFRCADSNEFNPNTQECDAKCTAVGLQADPRDCGSYYECYAWGGRILKRKQQCWAGWNFNTQLKLCWLGDCSQTTLAPTTTTAATTGTTTTTTAATTGTTTTTTAATTGTTTTTTAATTGTTTTTTAATTGTTTPAASTDTSTTTPAASTDTTATTPGGTTVTTTTTPAATTGSTATTDTTTTVATTTLPPYDCTDVYGLQCNGCNEVVACLGDPTPQSTENCAGTASPYCLRGGCSTNPPSEECRLRYVAWYSA